MSNEQNKFPAFPTFPIQDNLGRVISFAGLTKLEYMAAHLAAGWWQHSNTMPETIASEAIQIAKEIIKQCQEETAQKETSKIIEFGK